jgi:hypothetical protein
MSTMPRKPHRVNGSNGIKRPLRFTPEEAAIRREGQESDKLVSQATALLDRFRQAHHALNVARASFNEAKVVMDGYRTAYDKASDDYLAFMDTAGTPGPQPVAAPAVPKLSTIVVTGAETSGFVIAMSIQDQRVFRINDGLTLTPHDQRVYEDGRLVATLRPLADGKLDLIEHEEQ